MKWIDLVHDMRRFIIATNSLLSKSMLDSTYKIDVVKLQLFDI